MTELRRAAFHEAGHAVIGRVLGLPCGRACLTSKYGDDTLDGWAKCGKLRAVRTAAKAAAMVSLSSLESEMMFVGAPDHVVDGIDRQRGAALARAYDLDLRSARAGPSGCCCTGIATKTGASPPPCSEQRTLDGGDIDALVTIRRQPVISPPRSQSSQNESVVKDRRPVIEEEYA